MGFDDDDNEEGSEDEDLAILRSALDVLCGSSEGTGPSGAVRLADAVAEEGSAQKRAASSPLRGTSPKSPCATVDGNEGPSCTASINPSMVGLEAPALGEGVENAVVMDAAVEADSEVRHPSLEMIGEEDQDLL